MSEEVKVTRVEVKMGKKTHMLTIEQAQALRDQLNELFGATVEEHHHHHHRDTTWPRYIQDIDKTPWKDKVWCHSTADKAGQLTAAPEYTATLQC